MQPPVKISDSLLKDLESYFDPGETVQESLASSAGEVGRLGELWLVLTDRRLYFHTRQKGMEPVVAMLPRSDLKAITYYQHSQGITLTFVPRSSPKSASKISFPKAQRGEVERFCEHLAELIIFQAEARQGVPVVEPRSDKDSLRSDPPVGGNGGGATATSAPVGRTSSGPLQGEPTGIQARGSEPTTPAPPGPPSASPASAPAPSPASQATLPGETLPTPAGPTAPLGKETSPTEPRVLPPRQDGPVRADAAPSGSPAGQKGSLLPPLEPSRPAVPVSSGPPAPLRKEAPSQREPATPSSSGVPPIVKTVGPRPTPTAPRPPVATPVATGPVGSEVRLAAGEGPGFRVTIMATIASLAAAFLWYRLFRALSGSR